MAAFRLEPELIGLCFHAVLDGIRALKEYHEVNPLECDGGDVSR